MTLTEHFSFEELTRTRQADLQDANRREARDYIDRLKLVAQMLGATPEIARTVITHRFALADAPEAFRVAGDRAAGAIKVVLQP